MKNYSKRALLVNTLGSLGYLFCLLSWCWVTLLYLPMLLENEQVGQFILPTPSQEVVPNESTPETSLPMIILAVTVTILILIATIVVLLRAPITIAKTGKTVTSKLADATIPLVTKGRQLPVAKKKLLTANLIKLTKLLLVLLPFAAVAFGVLVELPLPFNVAIFLSGILSLFALLWFSTQYVLAHLLGVENQALV